MECIIVVKLDWLSFSFFQAENHYETDKEAIEQAYQRLLEGVGEGPDRFFTMQKWENGPGRKPYSTSRRTLDGSIAVFANAKLPHALVEFSGKGMTKLLHSQHAEGILLAAAERVTRIDLACDFKTETDPREFAKSREKGRFKSGSEIVSESGTTVYVGSKTSNRYARVYRYAEPHPRHELLRVEHVFKGEDAKTMLAYILNFGYDKAAAQAQLMFGWKHADWNIEAAAETEVQAHREERGEAKTIYWLYDTVAPVIARLHNEGILNFGTFFSEAIAPKLSTPDDDGVDEPV